MGEGQTGAVPCRRYTPKYGDASRASPILSWLIFDTDMIQSSPHTETLYCEERYGD
jgi:hypothetical protein